MNATVFKPPKKNADSLSRVSVFLAGSIEMGAAVDWQTAVTNTLSDLPINIFNPRRDDWDSSWKQDISHPKFREQVEWELDHLTVADFVLFNFDPDTKAPITLLELGLATTGGGSNFVCCPPGFWRRGNVQIVCDRFNMPLFDGLDDAVTALIKAIKEHPQYEGA